MVEVKCAVTQKLKNSVFKTSFSEETNLKPTDELVFPWLIIRILNIYLEGNHQLGIPLSDKHFELELSLTGVQGGVVYNSKKQLVFKQIEDNTTNSIKWAGRYYTIIDTQSGSDKILGNVLSVDIRKFTDTIDLLTVKNTTNFSLLISTPMQN